MIPPSIAQVAITSHRVPSHKPLYSEVAKKTVSQKQQWIQHVFSPVIVPEVMP